MIGVIPVLHSVQANQSYTVAVYLASSGGSYRLSPSSSMFPMTIDENFRIDDSTFISTKNAPNNIPTNTVYPRRMYGQADVRFVPN